MTQTHDPQQDYIASLEADVGQLRSGSDVLRELVNTGMKQRDELRTELTKAQEKITELEEELKNAHAVFKFFKFGFTAAVHDLMAAERKLQQAKIPQVLKPNTDGHYWFRTLMVTPNGFEKGYVMIRVTDGIATVEDQDGLQSFNAMEVEGEWFGPIPFPRYKGDEPKETDGETE